MPTLDCKTLRPILLPGEYNTVILPDTLSLEPITIASNPLTLTVNIADSQSFHVKITYFIGKVADFNVKAVFLSVILSRFFNCRISIDIVGITLSHKDLRGLAVPGLAAQRSCHDEPLIRGA